MAGSAGKGEQKKHEEERNGQRKEDITKKVMGDRGDRIRARKKEGKE